MSDSEFPILYKQGVNGMIRDHAAEYEAVSGETDKTVQLGTPGIKDIRDNRDPELVGREYLAKRNGAIHGRNSSNGTDSTATGTSSETTDPSA